MKKILHIAAKDKWTKEAKEYRADTLETQGFIHCSTPEQVIEVANYLFSERNDLLLLVIDEEKVQAHIKYEDGGNGKFYPHIYGPLNTDAVISVLEFKPEKDGLFTLPNLD
jgi:uncharacterized protein (DUF952 family)